MSQSGKAQDMDAAQELQDLVVKMAAADDICPFMPRLRILVNRIVKSVPEVYEAMKPQLDELNKTGDDTCTETGKNGTTDSNKLQNTTDKSSQEPTEENAKSFDVRFTNQETRSLTDEEFDKLRKGLHYEPKVTALSLGGSATSRLKNNDGRTLATVMIEWIRAERPVKGTKKSKTGAIVKSYGVPVGYFNLTLQNASNCLYSSTASLVIPQSAIGAEAVSSITWSSWVTLHEPGRGQSTNIQTSAPIGNDYNKLLLVPQMEDYSLSQCRTPELK